MSASQALKADTFGGLTPHQLGTLYEPILLDHALHKATAFPSYPHESESQGSGVYGAEMPDLKAFQFYVNKLAQVCDNERGGGTISAIAILRGSVGPSYVIGSNSKDEWALKRTKSFVQTLLDLVGKNPEKLQSRALEKRVLWFILYSNIARLQEYLQYLVQAVRQCQEYCERWGEEKGRSRPEHHYSIMRMLTDKSLSDCETLIKAICTIDQTEISHRAQDAAMTRSEPWCRVRHYLGRWLSYRKATQGIIAVSQRWPDLFLDFEITMVPSSSKLPTEFLRSGLTSTIITQSMLEQDKIQDPEVTEVAENLARMGIDDVLRKSLNPKKFIPILHAEMLVYEYLSTSGQTATECYWNQWSYIGSSKPTCRLCYYYFDALQDDKPAVRPSHHNLYRNWRLPEHHDPKTRDELLNRIAQRIRADVIKTLKEKKLRRKEKDSNTYSSFPKGLRTRDHTSESTDSDDRESPNSTESQEASAGELEDVNSPID
ncbi:hypothetical protein LB507_005462 [Fusarium sp. FIESC RH6]|nr:hypothetical protein LB507_005462 [Fusarium sp. FIESC RH6]